MSKTRRFGILAATILVVAAATARPASAQGDVGIGYQFVRFSVDGDSITFPVGINADVTFPVRGPLSVVGEIGWARHSDEETVLGFSVSETATAINFGAGVRWTLETNAQARPWAQVIVGAQRTSFSGEVAGEEFDEGAETDALVGVEGGVTVPMGGLSLFGQVGYRRLFVDEGVNGLRVVAGVRLPLGAN